MDKKPAKRLVVVSLLAVLAACGSGGAAGINSLGAGFVNAFNQDRNDIPVDASAVALTLTPTIEPFDP